MSGNVDEWCNDVYDWDYYLYSPVDNPEDPTEGSWSEEVKRNKMQEDNICRVAWDERVLRGGNYTDMASECRVQTRYSLSTGYTGVELETVGFRLAMDI